MRWKRGILCDFVCGTCGDNGKARQPAVAEYAARCRLSFNTLPVQKQVLAHFGAVGSAVVAVAAGRMRIDDDFITRL